MIKDLDELEDISSNSDDFDKPGAKNDEVVLPMHPRPCLWPLYQRKNGQTPKDSDAALHSQKAPHSGLSQKSVNMPSSPPLAPISFHHPLTHREQGN